MIAPFLSEPRSKVTKTKKKREKAKPNTINHKIKGGELTQKRRM